MALTIVKRPLSFQTNGLPSVATTATGGLAHTPASSTSVYDDTHVFAHLAQSQTASVTAFAVINSSTYAITVPVNSFNYPLITGYLLQGNTSASNNRIEFYTTATGSILFLSGYVNRITES